MAELADAQDLKSCEGNTSYRFDPGLRHSRLSEIRTFSKEEVLFVLLILNRKWVEHFSFSWYPYLKNWLS